MFYAIIGGNFKIIQIFHIIKRLGNLETVKVNNNLNYINIEDSFD